MKNKIIVSTTIESPIEDVWKHFTNEVSIQKWNFANENWHCPSAKNDLKVDGKFCYKMAAKDGSFEFDLNGKNEVIIPNEKYNYSLEDGR